MKRITCRVLVSAAVAAAIGALGALASPHANADGPYVDIAWSKNGIGATGDGFSIEEARDEAINACTSAGGVECFIGTSDKNTCIALVTEFTDYTDYTSGSGATIDAAKAQALANSDGVGNDVVKEAICAVGGEKAAPAAPAATGTDTDGDGLSDRDEIGRFTNIFLPDTDLDGVSDGDEVKNGTNPLLLISN